MEILNVGAGQTNQEHAAEEERRRADLLAESQNCANYFFVAAGLCALGTGLLPVRINVLVSVGAVDLLSLYGGSLGAFLPLAVYALAGLWLLVLVVLAFAGRAGHRWAFLCGIVLYGADMLALMLLQEIAESAAAENATPIATQPGSPPSPGNTPTDSRY